MATTFNTRNMNAISGLSSTPKVVPFEGPATIHIPAGVTATVKVSCDPALSTGASADWVPVITGQAGPNIQKIDLDFAGLQISTSVGDHIFVTSARL